MTTLTMTADRIGLTGLANWFKKLAASYKAYRLTQITISELSRLNDRELNDMGISRGDIYSIAHGCNDFNRSAKTEVNDNLKGWV